ncbi:hypothetical protein AK812_SmicGene7073 [Symbiodinium microadriaticum]|uniref:Uncharacterized protein n=1 Tax=Symbiodinium microadriaticum TaxID=2951 RepID=A0A1Q9EPJ7_SYMMI|nr:hypothetical protein AK812_SmicGene7073 [Symbiodinium microadriaticum]
MLATASHGGWRTQAGGDMCRVIQGEEGSRCNGSQKRLLNGGASKEPWSTSDEGHECFLCRCFLVGKGTALTLLECSLLRPMKEQSEQIDCCHNGRVKPDKKQRATVKSMSETQLLDLLLAQLSMRAQEAGRFDSLFPVLQAIHRRLSVSSTGESNISGASLRNLEKMMSKMSCQKMSCLAEKNPNVNSGILQLVQDQLNGSCPIAPFDLPSFPKLSRQFISPEPEPLELPSVAAIAVEKDAVSFSAETRAGCHNGRVKPDKKQRATVKSMSETQLLDLLLAQLSMRAQEAGRFDTLFPVLQAIHRRLSVSSTGESNISGASLRNLEKVMSKMSCQQMIFFAKKNPNADPGLLQLVMDQLTDGERVEVAKWDVFGRQQGLDQASESSKFQRVNGQEPLLQWSGEDQDQVQQLFDALPLHKQSAMMDLQAARDHAELYLEISRFNHSCRPNCEGSWDDRLDPASDKRRERLWQLVEEIPSCEDPEQGLNISCFREVAAYQEKS